MLTLFTKDNCQLCHEAKQKLDPFKERFRLREIDITDEGHEEWYHKYKYEIPVFFFEKKYLCKNFIDLEKFQGELEKFEGEQH